MEHNAQDARVASSIPAVHGDSSTGLAFNCCATTAALSSRKRKSPLPVHLPLVASSC